MLLNYYQSQCKQGLIIEDSAQLEVLQLLQHLYTHLLTENKRRSHALLLLRKPRLVKGIYLWGGVGIGKTFLIDCLYQCLPLQNKLRMHFHQFMQVIHNELTHHQGQKDPLKLIAKNIAKKNMILFFDEFIVNDIADAMILGRLFKLLFSYGVCLVTTSNIKPDDLYKRGLQRKSFLPTIALIKQHTNIVHLAAACDYRAKYLNEAGVFYTSHDEKAEQKMQKCFSIFARDEKVIEDSIEINGRYVQIYKRTQDTIWFDFNKLCTVPRSQHDYLVIASQYKTIFISHVPAIPMHANNTINLFIRMIDIFYDKHIRLILSADVSLDDIYREGYMQSDFKRTRSRLLEMQSAKYYNHK